MFFQAVGVFLFILNKFKKNQNILNKWNFSI